MTKRQAAPCHNPLTRKTMRMLARQREARPDHGGSGLADEGVDEERQAAGDRAGGADEEVDGLRRLEAVDGVDARPGLAVAFRLGSGGGR